MIPRSEIQVIAINEYWSVIEKFIKITKFSTVLFCRGNIDNIIGVAFMYDLFQNPESIREIIQPITYTPENKKCNELLQEFRKNNTSIAIVIDEYGGTAGIVTTEDLMEELFGELEELPILEDRPIRALNQSTWQVSAAESIENVNEILNLEIPSGNYETLSGFTKLGKS